MSIVSYNFFDQCGNVAPRWARNNSQPQKATHRYQPANKHTHLPRKQSNKMMPLGSVDGVGPMIWRLKDDKHVH